MATGRQQCIHTDGIITFRSSVLLFWPLKQSLRYVREATPRPHLRFRTIPPGQPGGGVLGRGHVLDWLDVHPPPLSLPQLEQVTTSSVPTHRTV